MTAHESLHPIQFKYDKVAMGGKPWHRVTAYRGDTEVGQMDWTSKGIRNINATPKRQGVGTALWQEGHRLASENQRIPAPRHSSDRTNAGDAWAKSVGGPLPRLRQFDDSDPPQYGL